MKLYECTNGWLGESYCRVYVIAETLESAYAMAADGFKAGNQPSQNIQVVEMCADTSQAWVSKVSC
jgi:hypothetical protein